MGQPHSWRRQTPRRQKTPQSLGRNAFRRSTQAQNLGFAGACGVGGEVNKGYFQPKAVAVSSRFFGSIKEND